MHEGQWRVWRPYVGRWDPCPPILVKRYIVPPSEYMNYQPMNLPQFPLDEALFRGTLWPVLYSPYVPSKT